MLGKETHLRLPFSDRQLYSRVDVSSHRHTIWLFEPHLLKVFEAQIGLILRHTLVWVINGANLVEIMLHCIRLISWKVYRHTWLRSRRILEIDIEVC